MTDGIIIAILVVVVFLGIRSTVKHFARKSGCCGGNGTYIAKKKLKKVIETKTFIVDGMECKNCETRILRYINDIPGAVGKINLKKKQLIVSMERNISDDEIIASVTKAGYKVI